MRILVIDKNEDSADALAALLTLIGRVAEFAVSLDDISVRGDPPHVIVLGLGFLDRDARDFVQRIRSVFPGIRLVAITGSRHSDEKRAAIGAGCDEVLYYLSGSEELQRQLIDSTSLR